jgi:hypothetical protein
MYKSTRRYGLQSSVFVTDPWALVEESIRERCAVSQKDEALASVQQARFFYEAGVAANLPAAKPLLLYYAFMNLGKSYALTVGQRPTFDGARHGIRESPSTTGAGLGGLQLIAYQSPDSRGCPNLFEDVLDAASGGGLGSTSKTFSVANILPQIVAGHRIWADASQRRERFIAIEQIQVMYDPNSKTIWLQMKIYADDLTRLGITHSQLLQESRLSGTWREVTPEIEPVTNRRLLLFEQITPSPYNSRPSDQVPELIKEFRHSLWTVVLSVPPYRKYYVYLAPVAEHGEVLPQLMSVYALMFLLGSITRYRPQQFNTFLTDQYGAYLFEFLASQPKQFLYLFASEFAQREVTQPAIVQ